MYTATNIYDIKIKLKSIFSLLERKFKQYYIIYNNK